VGVCTLEQVVEGNVRALLRRFGLNRDSIIGLIGDRGSGKSLSGANIAIRDFMMTCDHVNGNGPEPEPCWSNMQMKLSVNVDDEDAQMYGLKGGQVVYEAQHIDKQAFLRLDSRYEGGVLFFDEFNLEYGEARRSGANVNLMTDRAVQQLRKLQCGLVYTVLSEMYVDVRIRENTDIYIKCHDVALKPENMRQGMKQGIVFEWLLYLMSDRAAGIGRTYSDTQQPVGPVKLVLRPYWDAIDTYERQAEGRTSYTDKRALLPVEMKEDPTTTVERDKWGWLDTRIREFFDKHADDGDEIELTTRDFAHELGIAFDDWPRVVRQVWKRLPDMEVKRGAGRGLPTKYTVRNAVLPRA